MFETATAISHARGGKTTYNLGYEKCTFSGFYITTTQTQKGTVLPTKNTIIHSDVQALLLVMCI